jgi:rhodanese-related sulfurtransferase
MPIAPECAIFFGETKTMQQDKTDFTEPTKITVDDAKGRLDRDEPLVFVDARSPKAWDESDAKLPGAIRLPPDQVEQHLHELPHDQPIVIYCAGPHEASSARVAEELAARGFKNAHPLYGGFNAWKEAGYPLEPK